MTPERWSQVEKLYNAALERQPAERLAFLDSACPDEELRREVQSLLEHEHEGDRLLENSPLYLGASLSPGTRLGPYEIVASIGAGGMGEVYRARDTRLERTVAIKVLHSHLDRDAARKRFEREARAVSALNHAHICTLHDIGRQDGIEYLVMEYLEGETLAHKLEKGPLPLDQALRYAIQIASALDQAHRHRVIHRDLKPANIMLTKSGAKVLDFGVAKVRAIDTATHATTLTEEGAIVGTVQYMAPEQLEGKEADARTDIFAFGAVVYEMAAGKKAFEGESEATLLSAIMSAEPVPLSVPLLDRAIRRCLAKDPEDRWQSAADLTEALQWIGAAPAPGMIETRRTRWGIWAGAAIATVLAIAAAAAWWARMSLPEAPTLRYLTYSGHDWSPAASPDGRTIAFSSDRDGRLRIWLKDLARGDELPLTTGPNDDFPRFSPDSSMILFSRGEGLHRSLYRIAVLGGEPRRLVEDASSGDWSPDGRQIAFIRMKSETRSSMGLVSADGTGAHEIVQEIGNLYRSGIPSEFPFALGQPRWSPDGRTIAADQIMQFAGAPSSLFLVGADGKGPRRLPALPGGYKISAVAWSGSDEVVYSQNESVGGTWGVGTARLVRQNVRSGAAHSVLRSPHNSSTIDLVSPTRVVFDALSIRQSLREFSLGSAMTSSQSRWLTRGNSQDRQPAYSPDGEWVVFSSDRSGNLDLWVVSTKTGAVRRITEDPADDWDPAFTPGGKNIVWSSNRTGHFEIWIANADGSGARQVTRHGTDAENPTATPDGWIVYLYSDQAGEYGLGRIRPDGSQAVRILAGRGIPEVSPDGRYVAQASPEFGLRVVRVADGAVVETFQIPDAGDVERNRRPDRCRWMPDGRAIAFLGADDNGVEGIFIQDFVPGKDTSKTRRRIVSFDGGMQAQTFGISPDGSRMTTSSGELFFSLMIAERVPGVFPPARRMR